MTIDMNTVITGLIGLLVGLFPVLFTFIRDRKKDKYDAQQQFNDRMDKHVERLEAELERSAQRIEQLTRELWECRSQGWRHRRNAEETG